MDGGGWERELYIQEKEMLLGFKQLISVSCRATSTFAIRMATTNW